MPEPVATRTPPSRAQEPTTVSAPRRPPPPRCFVPNDSLFAASCFLIADSSSNNDERYFKARSQLPTPVSPRTVPVSPLATEHSTDEILQSLAGDAQPETWRTHKASLKDFSRVPNQGISFLCTSDAALYSLGGLKLTICRTSVNIHGYSRYDKLYYVYLTCLPWDNWFVAKEELPVIIKSTYVAAGLNSRDRTVYFSSVNYPSGLILPCGEPLREIQFDPNEKPCFVQHRLRKSNRLKPTSLFRIPPTTTTATKVTSADSSMGDAPVQISHINCRQVTMP
ncbi:hypothetical protein PsorP6_007470 [Peronosclerospora sorghi]|uniref:Uncharacterized protein n=1 Tax=Peronosclerospora sorghi TaxID=230839 RepID=A0ACC0W9M0_9STRA|nr:hypothetical protein PsorP6_007470 [Peronosclerospora sorghi]